MIKSYNRDVVGEIKVCYQLADIRESAGGDTVRTVTECEGSSRLSHAYTSTGNSIFIEVIVAKILNVHFLLHFKGQSRQHNQLGLPGGLPGDIARGPCQFHIIWHLFVATETMPGVGVGNGRHLLDVFY